MHRVEWIFHCVVLFNSVELYMYRFLFSCSHVRFRAEPFQILTVPISTTNSTLEKIISQLTKIEMVSSRC